MVVLHVTMGTTGFAIICSVLILIGLIGALLPAIPGVPIAWLGLFIYAIGTGFERISILTVAIFFGITVITLTLDFVAPMLGAKKYRASKLGVAGAFVGFVAGVILLGFWGVILGPLVGAFLGELIASRKPKKALGSALGAFLGFIAGTLIKIVVILTMAGFFIASLF